MLNKVQIIGRVGQAPEAKTIGSGTIVTKFSVACNETWKDKSGEKQEKTTWIPVTAWNSLGEFSGKYIQKGTLVYVEGKYSSSSYEKDGVTKYSTEVVANNIQLLSPKSENANQNTGQAAPAFDDTSSIPF